MDLADAHLLALENLFAGADSDVFNCGYGHGYSVQEVIQAALRVTGKSFKIVKSERREGDPSILVAESSKIIKHLNWKPRYDDLNYIIKTAWEWEQKL